MKVDLRFVLRRFIGLASYGFKSRFSRFDVAFDEKHNKCDTDEQFLCLDRIKEKLLMRHFVTRFRKSDPVHDSCDLQPIVFDVDVKKIDKKCPFEYIESENLCTGRIGKTIYLGKVKSNSFVRFYDKLAELEAHNFEVPPELGSWVRFEIEFKSDFANSVGIKYALSENDCEFVDHIRSVALNMIRFIEPDRSRRYNCTVSSWWYNFLNKVKAAKLVHNKPKYNKYVRSLESFKRQHACTLFALLMCDRRNLNSILIDGVHKSSKSSQAIQADFEAIRALDSDDYERVYKESTTPETGVEFWKRHVCDPDIGITDEQFDEFMSECVADFCREVERILDAAAV